MTKRIFWQVGENNEHDIPIGAKVVVLNKNSTLEIWFEDDDIIIQSISEENGDTFTTQYSV